MKLFHWKEENQIAPNGISFCIAAPEGKQALGIIFRIGNFMFRARFRNFDKNVYEFKWKKNDCI